jgi:hypoxanthine phosphoribosyltransferase
MNNRRLSWNEYHEKIDLLALGIKSFSPALFSKDFGIEVTNIPYKHIFAATTDDLVFGAHLSYRLKIPMVTDISLLTFMKNLTELEDQDVLLVSNIVQTGATFGMIKDQLECKFHTASLFVDKESTFVPSFFGEWPEDYIVFPWED